MFVQVFPSGPFSTNAYIVACLETMQAAIIDPAPDSFQVLVSFIQAQGFFPKKILLTHSHWDHMADVQPLKEKYQLPVYVHSLDRPNLEQPGTDGLPCWLTIPKVQPDERLEEGKEVVLGNLSFQVLHTPGHSPGSVCFYEPTHATLFSGDTLFQGSIGNVSFPTSQPALMWLSLKKLQGLPAATRVLPGHGPETTLLAESTWMPRAKELFDL